MPKYEPPPRSGTLELVHLGVDGFHWLTYLGGTIGISVLFSDDAGSTVVTTALVILAFSGVYEKGRLRLPLRLAAIALGSGAAVGWLDAPRWLGALVAVDACLMFVDAALSGRLDEPYDQSDVEIPPGVTMSKPVIYRSDGEPVDADPDT